MSAVPLVKCINGHTGCAATERYLERNGRAIGHGFINLDCMDRDGGAAAGWAAEMDELRALYGNAEPYRGKPAITYRRYIVSPDPADRIDPERLRELSVAWAQKHFGDYQTAIVYHDDNEHRIPHAHIVVNNTNVETGRRLHVPDPKGFNRDLQQMARERGLGYLADEHHLYDKKAKGSSRRTARREFKGGAERGIEREGGHSWVADIRERTRTARALSHDEASYRELLGVLGVEPSLNSPNARRRDYLYAFADHQSRKVGGEKLGWPYGKRALEDLWLMHSPLREEQIRKIAEHTILIKDLDELREVARVVETIKDNRFASLEGIDRATIILEHRLEHAETQQERADLAEKIERLGRARQLAVKYRLLPAKDPEYIRTHPSSQRSSTSWSSDSSSHRSSSHQEHSIEHSSRDDRAR